MNVDKESIKHRILAQIQQDLDDICEWNTLIRNTTAEIECLLAKVKELDEERSAKVGRVGDIKIEGVKYGSI
ncbi:MAG: hypothetical protein ACRCZ0_07395 [Cetobacterium sp.]